MLKLKKVAVTGGIASGKSTVCRMFAELGAYVISADNIVHQLLDPTTDIGQQVIALLGNDIVVGDELNRERIAQKVFRDHSLLNKLERLLHPEVEKVIETHYNQISKKKYPLFVVEIPLFFEAGFQKDYDLTLVVMADEKRCRERFQDTTHQDANEFTRRNERLIPMQKKQELADLVIENNGSLEQLRQKVTTIFNSFQGTP